MAILQQIALNNPTKPSELRDNLDSRLEKICLKLMAGDQKKRYQSMNDVAADLQDVIKHPNRKQKKEAAQKTGPKPKAIPTAHEESNPALISVEQPKSYAEQLRKKKSKPSSKSAKSSKRLPVTSPTDSGINNKKYLIFGGLGGLILLLGIVFLVRVGKYDVQITLDDPSITLSVDGKVLNIKDGQDVYQLSAGEHKLQLQKDGLKTHVEEFTVSKDGKTALRAVVVNGKLDGLLNGEKPAIRPAPSTVVKTKNEPQSWTYLFDGKTATGWANLSSFKVLGNELVSKQNGYARSAEKYQDFELDFEWAISSGGNGGVYYRETDPVQKPHMQATEYQLLDNEGHPNGQNLKTSAGSLYAVVAPSQDRTKPVGQYNASRIVCRGQHVEHWMNGSKLLEYDADQVDPKRTSKNGFIYLQANGGEIKFRSIRIRHIDQSSSAWASPPSSNSVLEFDGINDYVELKLTNELKNLLQNPKSVTIEAWVWSEKKDHRQTVFRSGVSSTS